MTDIDDKTAQMEGCKNCGELFDKKFLEGHGGLCLGCENEHLKERLAESEKRRDRQAETIRGQTLELAAANSRIAELRRRTGT